MNNGLSADAVRKGIELAYLSYPDDEIATAITSLAVKHLQSEWARELRWQRDNTKAFLKTVKNTFLFDQQPVAKKIFLTQEQLLQLLVMKVGTNLEKEQESEEFVNQNILLARAIKEIIWFSLEKNPLCVISAITKVLHNYSNQDVVKVCYAVDDFYKNLKDIPREVRRAKESIFEQLTERFREVTEHVSTSENFHNDTFEVIISPELIETLYRCLEKFSPWNTNCINDLPAKTPNSQKTMTEGLEIAHSLIHKDCFEFLTELTEIATPRSQLQLEQLIFSNKMKPSNKDPFDPPDFTDAASDVLEELEEYKKSLKNSSPEQLSIFIDNKKVGFIDLNQTDCFQIEVLDQATQLTIYDHKTNLLLVSSRLTHQGILSDERLEKYYFHLANGQTFKLTIRAIKPIFLPLEYDDESGDFIDGKFQIVLVCYEKNLIKAIKRSYKRLSYEITQQPLATTTRFALILIVLALLLIIVEQFHLASNFNFNQQPPIVKKSNGINGIKEPLPFVTPTPEKQFPLPKQTPLQKQRPGFKQKPKKALPKTIKPAIKFAKEPEQIATRGFTRTITLSELKSIYVSKEIEMELREALTKSLDATGRFTVMTKYSWPENTPDAVVEWSLSMPNTLVLSTATSPYIWKKKIDKNQDVKQQAKSFTSDLIQAIQTSENLEKQKNQDDK